MAYRILLIGGGSGGHVYPLVAVGRALRQTAAPQGKEIKLVMLGEGKFFQELAKKEAAVDPKFKYHSIVAGKMRRYFSLASLGDWLKTPLSFIQSIWWLFWVMPDVIFSKSGYASFFPVLAAKLFAIPVYLHDSDAVPGVTSKVLGGWAKKVFTSFENASQFFPAGKTVLVGNPVREEILNGNKEEAMAFFQLSSSLPTVLISGGSQGAKMINDLVWQSLVPLTSQFQVVHQCGSDNYPSVQKTVEQITKEGQGSYGEQISSRYRLYPFFNDNELALAYAAADVIVGRAGAGTVFEMAGLGKPGIVIPIKKSASNHQYLNALEFSKYGGVVIEEDNLTPNVFLNELGQAYEHRQELGQNLRGFAKPEAARQIAEEIVK